MMGTEDCPGIIPRIGEELFFCVDKSLEECPDKKFLLTCSYLEIYNEALQDLLLPAGSKQGTKEAEYSSKFSLCRLLSDGRSVIDGLILEVPNWGKRDRERKFESKRVASVPFGKTSTEFWMS